MPDRPDVSVGAWDSGALSDALGVAVTAHGAIPSTMTAAADDPRTPAIHLAERQTEGRGRHGRIWESPPGNLYATIAWDEAEPRPGLLAAIQVAWAEAVIRAGGPRTVCKWPNDGLVAGGKWAGVLAKSAGGRLLVGLGANLERAPGGLEAGSAPGAALADHWRPWPGRQAVGRLLLAAALEVLRGGAAAVDALLARWPDHDALVRGESLRVATPDGARRGAYQGVAPDGRLRLALENGVVLLAAGEVSRVRPEG